MSRLSSVKQSMGWQSMNNRPACSNCRHVVERLVCSISTWSCRVGDFQTSALAVCSRHSPRGESLDTPAAQAVPQ